MGIVYKLKTEIKDFILEKKKKEPLLSCRQLSILILDKFQFKVSKSSVNSIIKSAGLSMSVGRRRKKRRRKPQIVAQPKEEIKLLAPPIEIPKEPSVQAPIEKPQEIVLEPALESPIEAPVAPSREPPVEVPVGVSTEGSVEEVAEIAPETESTGAIILKAADGLLGGSSYFTQAIRKRLNWPENDLLAKTESLIYLPLFGLPNHRQVGDLGELWSLVGKKFSLEEISSYLNELQKVNILSSDILRIISTRVQEVRFVKVALSEKSIFYFDGQLHTIWSTPHIPYAFSTTIYNIKSYIHKYFQENAPFVLFIAPGYDVPTKEFFDFILSLEGREKKFSQLTLQGSKMEEIESMPIEQTSQRFLVFGLWPWQFGQYRKIKFNGEFKSFYFTPLKQGFYIAETEVELLQPTTRQRVTLRGCALKSELNKKIRLIILSNLLAEETRLEELAALYLNHWPNLEEGFQDFSRKIELFTYTATSQRFFSPAEVEADKEQTLELGALLDYYLKLLDLYVRWYFLPSGYEEEDFATIKERFYALKAKLKREKECLFITFLIPQGYPFLKDLQYLCRRINEREIVFPDGKRLWFLL